MSSKKGFSYERDLCHRLSVWWMGDLNYDDVVFWRTPCSGGQATMRAKKGLSTVGRHGDMAAVDERGRAFTKLFVVEAKRGYSRSTIHDLLDKPPTAKEQQYEEWLRKLTGKCKELDVPFWLLIHKRDRREEMAYVPLNAAVVLNLPSLVRMDTVKFGVVCGFTLKAFLEQNDRAKIEKVLVDMRPTIDV